MGIKKVLIVDDEPDMRIFVSTVVETMGLESITAKNGIEALKKARSEPPALVILDVMMPGIEDGVATYRHFRTDESLNQMPIIMLSAIVRKTFFHSVRMLSPHQDLIVSEPETYMEKPPDAGELVKMIENILKG